jgi:hypothetical protein
MFPRCVYHQNIFSVGFRTNEISCPAAPIIPINPKTTPTTGSTSIDSGRNHDIHASIALVENVITPAIQSIGDALPPRASSFNRSTRYAEKAK